MVAILYCFVNNEVRPVEGCGLLVGLLHCPGVVQWGCSGCSAEIAAHPTRHWHSGGVLSLCCSITLSLSLPPPNIHTHTCAWTGCPNQTHELGEDTASCKGAFDAGGGSGEGGVSGGAEI